MGKVCIICQADVEKGAFPVKEDRIITTIRAIKKKFGIAQMNELYICKNDAQKHAERRKSFERSMMVATVLAGLILVVVVLSIVLSGRLDFLQIAFAFILAGAVVILPIFKYTPAIEVNKVEKTSKKPVKKRR